MGKSQSKHINVEFTEPEGGYDKERLSLALRMLISEKDIIEFFQERCQGNYPSDLNSP